MKAIAYVNAATLKAVACAVMTDETRYYLKGVHVEFSQKGITLVATNGNVLIAAFKPIGDDDTPDGPNTIIPIDLVNRIKLARKSPEMVKIEIDGPVVTIEHGEIKIMGHAIEGTFPAWRNIIPTGEASGEVAHYDFEKLAIFSKAQKLLGAKHARVVHNGPNPALVDMRTTDIFGVIMGLRGDPEMKVAPDWL